MNDSEGTRESSVDSRPSFHFEVPRFQFSLSVLLLSIIGVWSSIILIDVQWSILSLIGWIGVFGFTFPLVVSMYYDTASMRKVHGWPRIRGGHYILFAAIPILNAIISLIYLVNRIEVSHFGRSIINSGTVHWIWQNPTQIVRSIYTSLGVVITVFCLIFILYIPVYNITSESHPVLYLFSLLILLVPLSILYFRRYAERRTKQAIDIGLRDLTIRFLPVIGVFYLVICLSFLLIIPGVLVMLPLLFVMSPDTVTALTLSFIYSLWIIPLAMLFVLPLRLIPWIRVTPYIIEKTGKRMSRALSNKILTQNQGESHSTYLNKIIPFSGHDHTNVTLNSSFDVSMPGYFGYIPKPVSDVEFDSVPSSKKMGAILMIPGVIFAAPIITFYQLNPDRALELASIFPAEDAIVIGLSYAGLPYTVVTSGVEIVGIDQEILSLGFIAGIVPAILMIPAAWHFALEYESILYKSLQRIGDSNHLLALWAVHLIPIFPLVYGFWWYRDRRSEM